MNSETLNFFQKAKRTLQEVNPAGFLPGLVMHSDEKFGKLQ